MLFKRKPTRRKVFCVGRNKTGTTTLFDALQGLGYRMGDQLTAEKCCSTMPDAISAS